MCLSIFENKYHDRDTIIPAWCCIDINFSLLYVAVLNDLYHEDGIRERVCS